MNSYVILSIFILTMSCSHSKMLEMQWVVCVWVVMIGSYILTYL